MQQRERETCARRQHNADTLTAIADGIRAARDLVKVGHLASQGIDGEQADAMAELLDTIGKRLAAIVERTDCNSKAVEASA